MWKWWKDAAQEARQAHFAGQAAKRRVALERPGSVQAAAPQLQLGSEPAPCAAGACEGAEQEAWKAELQVRPAAAAASLPVGGNRWKAALLCRVVPMTHVPHPSTASHLESLSLVGVVCHTGVPPLLTGLQAVTGAGYDAILSAPWYLNLGCYASDDWKKYYAGVAGLSSC